MSNLNVTRTRRTASAPYERPEQLLQTLIRCDTTNPTGNEAGCIRVLDETLQAAGFETEIIRDGSVALSWLASAKPDLVLLDLNLPGVDGTGILRHIRDDPRLDKVNVIVATAYSHLAESLQSAADWVFFKPVSFGDLRDLAMRLNAGDQSGEADSETTT